MTKALLALNAHLDDFDANRCCPKCGSDDNSVSYHADVHGHVCSLRRAVLSQPECCQFEHLCRTCGRCHFLWPESVVSA